MSDGYEVEPAELQRAAQEITGCVPAPRDVPLEEIPGDAERYGHGGVYAALSRFCTTWQIAAALLSNSAEKAGGSLSAVAADYLRRNQAAEADFGRIGMGIGDAVSGMGVGGGIGQGLGTGDGSGIGGISGGASGISDRLTGGSAEGAL